MTDTEFKFIDSYRTLLPTASSEIVAARQKGHDRLYSLVGSMDRVYELCCLVFHLPQKSASLAEWFEKTIKEFDPQFVIGIDKAEAGRIASLLLRDRISRGSPKVALAVLATSFCGRRSAADEELVTASRDAITDAGRKRRIVVAEHKIVAPVGQPKEIPTAFDAVVTDFRRDISEMATSANQAHQSLRDDVIRLAEEVDLLWWHVGDWIEVLDRRRGTLPKETVPIASGVEIGNLVRQVPGPYGVYGILHRCVGDFGDQKAKLTDVIHAIGDDVVKKLAHDLPQSMMSVFPIHAALRVSTDCGAGNWAPAFDLAAGDVKDFELTHYELALQAFRERVLIKCHGLGNEFSPGALSKR